MPLHELADGVEGHGVGLVERAEQIVVDLRSARDLLAEAQHVVRRGLGGEAPLVV